jgi:HEAT repeat protein
MRYGVFLLSAALFFAGGARADEPPHATLPANTAQRLKSNDAGQIKTALDDTRTAGKAGQAVAPLIVELLKRGLDADLTKAAILALGDTEAEAGGEILAAYARHRSLAIREAAVQALGKTRGPVAVKTLRAALSDDQAAVRRDAALGLGALHAREAVGDLFVALEHRVIEAAASIGQLCSAGECERLAAKIGVLPLDVVTTGLDPILFRPPSEVGDDTKVRVVSRLRELGTQEANKFLRDVQKRWKKGDSERVRRSIDDAVIATANSPGASTGANP